MDGCDDADGHGGARRDKEVKEGAESANESRSGTRIVLALCLWFVLAAQAAAGGKSPATLVGTTELPTGYAMDDREGESSPDGQFAFISPQGDTVDRGRASHYLVRRDPFRILAASIVRTSSAGHMDTERKVLWSSDSRAALLLAEGDRRVVGATLFELRASGQPRRVDLYGAIIEALAPKFPTGKVKPFGKSERYVLQEDERDLREAWSFTRSGRLLMINIFATTQPRMLGEGAVWSGELEGVWDVAAGRWGVVQGFGKVIRR